MSLISHTYMWPDFKDFSLIFFRNIVNVLRCLYNGFHASSSNWGWSSVSASRKRAGILGLPEPLISARRQLAKRAILVPSLHLAYLPPSAHVPCASMHACHTSCIKLTKSHIQNVTIKVLKEWFKGSFLMTVFKSWKAER